MMKEWLSHEDGCDGGHPAVLRTLPFGIQKSELPKNIFPPRNRLCELCEGIIKKDGA